MGDIKIARVPISLGEAFIDWCFSLIFLLPHLLPSPFLFVDVRSESSLCPFLLSQPYSLQVFLPVIPLELSWCLLHRGPEPGQVDQESSEKTGVEPLWRSGSVWHMDGLWWPWNSSAQIFVQEHQLQGVILTDGPPGCSHHECRDHLASGWSHPMPKSDSDNDSGPLLLMWDILMGTISSGTPKV